MSEEEMRTKYMQNAFALEKARDELENYSKTTFVFDPKIQELTKKIRELKQENNVLFAQLADKEEVNGTD